MAESGITMPHALFLAPPFQGHFAPAVNFAIKLAAKGFIVTFVNTEAFHHQRVASGAVLPGRHDVFADARSKGLDIRYELVSDGLPASLDLSLCLGEFFFALFDVLPGHVEELVRKLLLAEPPVDVLIADTVFGWPSTVAKKYGLPYVSFWTQPALVFTMFYHMNLLIKNGHFASPENRKDTITYLPGVPAIEPADLVSFLQDIDLVPFLQDTDISRMPQMVIDAFEEAKGADFVLCNTVQELESEAIAALQQEKPFYAVGPIFPDGFTGGIVTTTLWPQHDCSQWLDSMPPASVLYVSFGSVVSVSKRDLEEIASGVLGSKASFIWALRLGTGGSEAGPLPDGFMEATKGRGIVMPWCSQKEVLMHPSVGGFLTHCGWNSVLESMWCGVPMLCFPQVDDQLTNRKLVVRDLGIGIDVGGVGEVIRDVVSSSIDSLMGGEDGVKVRRKMEEVRKVVKSAVTLNGSSCKNLDQFTVDLMKHLSKKKLPR